MNLQSWLIYLEQIHPRSIALGLERVQQCAVRMNILPLPCPVITVTGTNGKGSTVALLEKLYLQSHYRVAAYTSPHLLRFNERIRIQGQEVEDEALCAAFAQVEACRGTIPLTFFEFTTLAALYLFRNAALDMVLLEVGLGGRLDAVNVVNADLAILTSIALDHEDWLGSTREQVAAEKAGIMRPHCPVICGDPNPPKLLEQRAEALQAPFYQQDRDFGIEVEDQELTYWYEDLKIPLPHLKLHPHNIASALTAVQCMSPALLNSAEILKNALHNLTLCGRQQRVQNHIFDVAHNPAAAAYLASQLPSGKKIYAIFSMLGDKDIANTIKSCAHSIAHWFIAPLTVARAATLPQLEQAFTQNMLANYSSYPSLQAAYAAARGQAQPDTILLFFGSFHVVSLFVEASTHDKCYANF